jgi:excisionase family DNA binding protein
MPNELEMLRPAHVAAQLGVGAGRVYQLISKGVIPSVRVGGSIRIPRAAWEAWLRGKSVEALGGPLRPRPDG